MVRGKNQAKQEDFNLKPSWSLHKGHVRILGFQ